MRRLINYIRSCFCKHDWECLSSKMPVYSNTSINTSYTLPIRYEWVYRCRKCGAKNVIKN